MAQSKEVKVGLLVVAAAAILGGSIAFLSQSRIFEHGYTIQAQFDFVGSLIVGAPVKLAGVDIGRVSELHVRTDPVTTVDVTLWIREGVDLRSGSRAAIMTLGLMGEKYIELFPGPEDAALIGEGSSIKGIGPAQFDRLLTMSEEVISGLVDTLGSINTILGVEGMETSISETMDNMRSLSWELRELVGRLNGFLAQNTDLMSQTVEDVRTTATEARDAVEALSERVETVAAEAEGVFEKADGLLGDNSDDITATIGHLAAAAESLSNFAAIIESDPRALLRGVRESDRARTAPGGGALDRYEEERGH